MTLASPLPHKKRRGPQQPRPKRDSAGKKHCFIWTKRDYGWNKRDNGGSNLDNGRSKLDYGWSKLDYGWSNRDYGRSNRDYGRSNRDYGWSKRDYGWSKRDYGWSNRSLENCPKTSIFLRKRHFPRFWPPGTPKTTPRPPSPWNLPPPGPDSAPKPEFPALTPLRRPRTSRQHPLDYSPVILCDS